MPQALSTTAGFRRLAALIALLFGALLIAAPVQTQTESAPVAHVMQMEGAIGPATADYVKRGFADAREAGAEFVVIRIDTPGGLDTSMREIIRDILASPIPIVSYVAPDGARAASAGTFILYASHVAAMAPGTNLGAATPVQIGGGGGSPGGGGEGEEQGNKSASATAMERKVVNDAVAYIRALAQLRGRDADWGEEAVRTGASLDAPAALEQRVIDIVARDLGELMKAINGKTVSAAGRQVTIDTQNIRLVEAPPNWRTKVLNAITNPNVALILMLIGIYGLMFEFMNPGALYPGTIGAISLLVGLYALAALPVNFAGVALLLLGLALIVAEAFTPSFGVLGIAGVAALALGATIMIDTDVPEFQVSWAAAAGLAVASMVIVIVIVRFALTSRRAKVVSGREEMVGARGEVIDWRKGRGHVFVHGERWRARGVDPLHPGAAVDVVDIDGLTLSVTQAPETDPDR